MHNRLGRSEQWVGFRLEIPIRNKIDFALSTLVGGIHPNESLRSDACRLTEDYFRYSYRRKEQPLGKNPSLRKEALRLFHLGEEVCKEFNNRLNISFPGDVLPGNLTWPLITRIREKISSTLGEFNPNIFLDLCRHGPHSTTKWNYSDACDVVKFSSEPHVTPLASPLAMSVVRQTPAWANLVSQPKLVKGAKFTTVPKDSRKDRSICIEPCLNMFLQRGIGLYISERLHKRLGLRLKDVPERNRRRALVSSTDRTWATIDLENASNSISYGVIKLLLPPKWFEVLDVIRSHGCSIDGVDHRFQMFSTMGNGFTFELETLLFWAISSTVDPLSLVFGDDITCRAEKAPAVISLLADFGFSTNHGKTFIRGFLFESCGGHYLNGFDITPVYLKKLPTNLPELFVVINQLELYCDRLRTAGLARGFLAHVESVVDYLIKFVPPFWRSIRVPGATSGSLSTSTRFCASGGRDYWVKIHGSYFISGYELKIYPSFSRKAPSLYWTCYEAVIASLYKLSFSQSVETSEKSQDEKGRFIVSHVFAPSQHGG